MGKRKTGEYVKTDGFEGAPYEGGLLASRLRKAREDASMSLREAATAVGVSTNTIINVEYGRNAPTARVLYRMSQVYGVSLDWLMGNVVLRGRVVGTEMGGGTA